MAIGSGRVVADLRGNRRVDVDAEIGAEVQYPDDRVRQFNGDAFRLAPGVMVHLCRVVALSVLFEGFADLRMDQAQQLG